MDEAESAQDLRSGRRERQRAANAKWRAANAAQVRERSQKYHAVAKAKRAEAKALRIAAQVAAAAAVQRQRRNKCGVGRPIEDFAMKGGTASWRRRGTCRECQNAASRARHDPDTRRAAYLKAPERAHAANHKSRAKRAGVEGTHSAADLVALRAKQGGRCPVCNANFRQVRSAVDHIKPLAKGGTNWPRNLQLLCVPCNSKKQAIDPLVFMRRQGFLL